MAGQPLDAIIKKDLLGSRDFQGNTSYETINSSGNTISVNASGSEQGYLCSVTIDNGVGNDIDFSIQGSLDDVSFADVDDPVNFTDTDGSITFDIVNGNANFVRIAWTVNSGSADIYVQFSAKRRH